MNLSALLGAAATSPTPVQPVAVAAAAVSGLFGGLGGLFGSGGTDTDNARAARVSAYLTGALAGDVNSIRLALKTATEVGAASEKAMYQTLIQQFQSQVPGLYNQAVAAGGLQDHEDGQIALNELLINRIHFAAAGAGHPTGNGHYANTDPLTLQIVAQLAALPLTPSGFPSAMTAAAPLAGLVLPLGSALPVPGIAGTSGVGAAPVLSMTHTYMLIGLVVLVVAAVFFAPKRG